MNNAVSMGSLFSGGMDAEDGGRRSAEGMRSLFAPPRKRTERREGKSEGRLFGELAPIIEIARESPDPPPPDEAPAGPTETIFDNEKAAEVAECGSVEKFRDLVESTVVSPYRTGMKLIHYASFYDLDGVFAKLVESGESPHARTGSGSAPIHLIALRSDGQSMETIIDRFGADPDSRDMMQWTPLHCVVARSEFLGQKEDVAGIMEVLLDRGADINALTDANHNALHLCARCGDPKVKVMDMLVRRRCDWTAVDREGMTPLEIARDSRGRDMGRFPDKMARAIRRARRERESVPRAIKWIGGVVDADQGRMRA